MLKYMNFLGILMISSCLTLTAESELERIIPPEIKHDAFYEAIYRLASTEVVSTILEIGSSSGDGSTEAFVKGISKNPHHPVLFCMELSKPRFTALKQRYKHLSCVRCYNVSSIPLESFPQASDVRSFLNTTKTNLNMYGEERVIGWLKQDIEYVKSANRPQNGIEIVKAENGIENFDIVLIDGSEFTGMAEFKLIYGAKFILLDDINAFKNYNNYHQLLEDPNYELVEKNDQLRNSYAIVKRTR